MGSSVAYLRNIKVLVISLSSFLGDIVQREDREGTSKADREGREDREFCLLLLRLRYVSVLFTAISFALCLAFL